MLSSFLRILPNQHLIKVRKSLEISGLILKQRLLSFYAPRSDGMTCPSSAFKLLE